MLSSCAFEKPDGRSVTVFRRFSSDDEDVVPLEVRRCGITLTAVREDRHNGDWRCILGLVNKTSVRPSFFSGGKVGKLTLFCFFNICSAVGVATFAVTVAVPPEKVELYETGGVIHPPQLTGFPAKFLLSLLFFQVASLDDDSPLNFTARPFVGLVNRTFPTSPHLLTCKAFGVRPKPSFR